MIFLWCTYLRRMQWNDIEWNHEMDRWKCELGRGVLSSLIGLDRGCMFSKLNRSRNFYSWECLFNDIGTDGIQIVFWRLFSSLMSRIKLCYWTLVQGKEVSKSKLALIKVGIVAMENWAKIGMKNSSKLPPLLVRPSGFKASLKL